MAKSSNSNSPENIDAYIAGFPKDMQVILQKVRETIRRAAPGAEETISYNMPTFKLNGNYLIHFAGWKRHISLYPFPSGAEDFLKEATGYKTSGKGTIQFPVNKPLPVNLITKIVKYRIKENSEAQISKKH